MGNPVCWFEIYVQDMARAVAFYEGMLGLKLAKMEAGDLEMWSFPMDEKQPGSGGALVRMQDCPSGAGGTMVYFGCEDCAVEESRVAQFGGKVHRPKISIGPYGFISLALDPDGNLIGLYSRK